MVIGGSGLIGTKLVNKLRQRGHEGLAASPASSFNTYLSVTSLTESLLAARRDEGVGCQLVGAAVMGVHFPPVRVHECHDG